MEFSSLALGRGQYRRVSLAHTHCFGISSFPLVGAKNLFLRSSSALQVGGKEISREAFDLLYLESKKEKAVESFGPVPLNHLIEDWSQAVKAEA